MFRVIGCFTEMHSPGLVFASLVLAVLASAATTIILNRARLARGAARFVWLDVASVAAGAGVWSTHFVAMLAYSPEVPVGYDPALTAASLLVGMVGARASFALMFTSARTPSRVWAGGALAGVTIAATHYLGMSGILVAARQLWAPDLIVASVLLSALFASGAAWLARRYADDPKRRWRFVLGSPIAMALAIGSLHYVGMGALTLIPDPSLSSPHSTINNVDLATMTAAAAIVVLSVGVIAALSDYRIVTVEQASAQKSQFLSSMSHELRTPLNAIIGYAGILKEDLEDMGASQSLHDATRIESAANHLLTLINQILDISKIEAGRMEITLADTNLTELLEEALDTMRPVALKRGNALDLRVTGDIAMVRIDATKLRQCILNLLGNALKFTEAGSVTVEADVRSGPNGRSHLHLIVADTGIGMTSAQVAKLFQPFTQANAAISAKYGGTGLGLAITRAIAELLGGSVSVSSTLGVGSTFHLEVPLHPVQPARQVLTIAA